MGDFYQEIDVFRFVEAIIVLEKVISNFVIAIVSVGGTLVNILAIAIGVA